MQIGVPHSWLTEQTTVLITFLKTPVYKVGTLTLTSLWVHLQVSYFKKIIKNTCYVALQHFNTEVTPLENMKYVDDTKTCECTWVSWKFLHKKSIPKWVRTQENCGFHCIACKKLQQKIFQWGMVKVLVSILFFMVVLSLESLWYSWGLRFSFLLLGGNVCI